MVWISWKNIMANRDFGGLGVGSIRSKNLSLLGKWRWRFLMEKEAIWRKVISKFHGVDGGFSNTTGPGLKKGVLGLLIAVTSDFE
ncbi:hypothetical protein CTI12_AA332140 [Artemisia annua]|uniref:RNA-directed DNA polymerase, eukaryota, Reverse transcriptase zinc-binding domain protein n=1 Tax=Artemisia annua TaxID=35608 RepID=A0A2U1MWG9_ARTAN|nr:hypothetical protein CTI12_AA332140 [Artemisia annua]